MQQDECIRSGLGRLTGFPHCRHQILDALGVHLAKGQGPEGWKEMRLESRAVSGKGRRLPVDYLQAAQQPFADRCNGQRSTVLRHLRFVHQAAQLCLGFRAG